MVSIQRKYLIASCILLSAIIFTRSDAYSSQPQPGSAAGATTAASPSKVRTFLKVTRAKIGTGVSSAGSRIASVLRWLVGRPGALYARYVAWIYKRMASAFLASVKSNIRDNVAWIIVREDEPTYPYMQCFKHPRDAAGICTNIVELDGHQQKAFLIAVVDLVLGAADDKIKKALEQFSLFVDNIVVALSKEPLGVDLLKIIKTVQDKVIQAKSAQPKHAVILEQISQKLGKLLLPVSK